MIKAPSTKVLSVFIVAVALVASIIIAFGRERTGAVVQYANNLVVGEKIKIPGNPNWQDELGNLSADTDLSQAQAGATENNSVTEVVSTSLFSNYLTLKQGGNLDEDSAQKLIDQTLDFIGGPTISASDKSELTIVPDNGRYSMAEYGDNIGYVLKRDRPEEMVNEVEIATQAIENRNQEKMAELDKVAEFYRKKSEELIKVSVPQTFVKAHLDLVAGTRGMAAALTEVKKILDDPIKGLSALKSYEQSAASFAQAMRAIGIFIIQNNIVYKQGSGGYYLFYGI